MSFILSKTTSKYPSLPYQKVAEEILGKSYILSLTFVGKIRGQKINQETRQKGYVPNVLSFPLNKNIGEIYITPAVAKNEAKKFGHTYEQHILFLFIHGLLHLKGYDHGEEMEKLEEKFLKKFCKLN